MRKRNVKKQFWINQVEAKELERKAKLAGLNESDFLRMLIMKTTLKEKPGPEFYEYEKLMRAIGINLNQVARVANKTGNINKDYYEEEARKWNEFMVKVKRYYLNS